MPAKFRVGAEINNFFNPGAPYTDITVTDISDAYFEVQYFDGSTTPTRVFSWSNVTNFEVLSD